MDTTQQNRIDLRALAREFWSHRRTFLVVWSVVLVLSAGWIYSLPRYYKCEVKLAPENGSPSMGGLASIASSLGFNLHDADNPDAISPTLYPELFTSPEFLVDVLSIQVTTDDARVTTDYYDYLRHHQREPWFVQLLRRILPLASHADDTAEHASDLNPAYLSKKDYILIKEELPLKIHCRIDRKTEVISIRVEDQDKLVSASLADSIRVRLQDYIIDYRTRKSRQDMLYYKHLMDSALLDYEHAIGSYGSYLDHNRKATRQTTIERGKKLSNDLSSRLQQYNMLHAQYQAMRAKVQETTPAFTTLTSATVPQKPAGPKRVLFVLTMLTLATILTTCYKMHRELRQWF